MQARLVAKFVYRFCHDASEIIPVHHLVKESVSAQPKFVPTSGSHLWTGE